MSVPQTVLLIALAVVFFSVIVTFIRSRMFFKGMLFSLISGFGSLGIIQLLSGVTGVSLGFNLFSSAVAVALGLPGVVGMLAFKLICAG